MAARDLGSRPPIVAEVGGLEPSVPLVLLLVGEKPSAVRPRSHIVRPARPLVDHYPRTKSEDDAVGAPRLVSRRWGLDLIRRSATPRRQSAKPQWDVGVGPRSTSILKF
jgi:hypothetical protein